MLASQAILSQYDPLRETLLNIFFCYDNVYIDLIMNLKVIDLWRFPIESGQLHLPFLSSTDYRFPRVPFRINLQKSILVSVDS